MFSELEIRGVKDPYADAKARGWDITNASALTQDMHLEADVVIVGTGSGGGTTANILSEAGLKVVMLEEGILKTSDQFNMVEREGLTDLYQEGAMRHTKDGSILVAQGRNVGGGTTVNWCSTFRTPPQTLAYWASEFGVKGLTEAELAPHFEDMESQLNVMKWMAANPNNEVLKRGAQNLGVHWDHIPRNVFGCINIGYCGVGCPMDAKKSMLVSTIPEALSRGSSLVYRVRVEGLDVIGDKVAGVTGRALGANGRAPTGRTIKVRARHTVLSGGAINTPGILLRSGVPDPHDRIGKRTFLHPVVVSLGQFKERIDPYYGAPQSIYSDAYTWRDGVDGGMGFKLEALPLLPGTFASLVGGHGQQLFEDMQNLSHTNALMSLLRDGFHEDSPGGSVELGAGGAPVLDYPMNDYFFDGAKQAYLGMMELQLAAGAQRVRPVHNDGRWVSSPGAIESSVEALDMAPHKLGVSSAHPMGGCAMGEEDRLAVTDSRGRFRHLEQLSIHDGSLFPTGLGTNPQMSIFGITAKLSHELAAELTQGS